MFELDVMLKFWELLFALAAAGIAVIGASVVYARVRKRRIKPAFYVEAGGVALSLGEDRLLEAIALASGEGRNVAALAASLGIDAMAVYSVAHLLREKNLIVDAGKPDAGGPAFELSDAGTQAALARGYIKLM